MPANQATDHENNIFPSERAMCRHWRIPYKLYTGRKYAGWDVKRALTTPVSKTVTAPDGTEYPTLKAMCAAHGISVSAYNDNLKKGMPPELALAHKSSDGIQEPMPCTDHTGQAFSSARAMCRAWGVNYSTFRHRFLKKHMPLKRALTGQAGFEAPDGKTYPSREALYRAENVTGTSVRYYESKGMSLPEAIQAAKQSALDRGTPVIYNGEEYPHLAAACSAAGISCSTYMQRIRSGWSHEKALSTPPMDSGRPITVFDIKYPSIAAMCGAFHISVPVMSHHRKYHGMIDDAMVSACRNQWPGKDIGPTHVIRYLGGPWFLCTDAADPDNDARMCVLHVKTVAGKAASANTDSCG